MERLKVMHCTNQKQCHLVIANASKPSLEYWKFIFTDLNADTNLNRLSYQFQEIDFKTEYAGFEIKDVYLPVHD